MPPPCVPILHFNGHLYCRRTRERAGQINPMKFFSMNRKRCFRYLKSRWNVPIIELYYFQIILEFFSTNPTNFFSKEKIFNNVHMSLFVSFIFEYFVRNKSQVQMEFFKNFSQKSRKSQRRDVVKFRHTHTDKKNPEQFLRVGNRHLGYETAMG